MRTVFTLLTTTAIIALTGIALNSCTDREIARVDPRQIREQKKEIPVNINRDLDILFVVDNSGSMQDEQDSLAANFNNFIDVLDNIEGGLPNVHIGVVSTDLGAGPDELGHPKCRKNGGKGDDGFLQNLDAQGAGCSTPDAAYISDISNEDGSRDRNYSGSLAETFSCIAQLGTEGCGFEQPLESMYRALSTVGPTGQNAGFLREDAFLAVIIITDEDDCSLADFSMLDSSAALDNNSSTLGYSGSFRCFEFGVTCDPDTPRTPGSRQNCAPRQSSTYLHNVDRYTEFLKGLKADPGKIIVAGIRGPSTDGSGDSKVNVTLRDEKPTLGPSCCRGPGDCTVTSVERADPAVRIDSFLANFPNRSTATTICDENLSSALTIIADLLTEVLGNPCVDGDLALTDGQPSCTVADVTKLNQQEQSEKVLPQCNDERSNVPCYRFEQDTMNCSSTPTQLALVIERGDTAPPTDTTVVARCVANG